MDVVDDNSLTTGEHSAGPDARFLALLRGALCDIGRMTESVVVVLTTEDASELIHELSWIAPSIERDLGNRLSQQLLADLGPTDIGSPADAETWPTVDGHRIGRVSFSAPGLGSSGKLGLAISSGDALPEPDLSAAVERITALFAYRAALQEEAAATLAAETLKLSAELDRLRENERIADIAGEMADFGSWSADFRTKSVTWTKQLQKIHEIPDDVELTPQQGMTLFDSPHRERMFNLIVRLKETGEGFDVETPARTYSGGHRVLRVMAHGEVENGVTIKAQGCVMDITQQKEAQRVIEEMAISDSLTGLLNRRAFESKAADFACPCVLVLLDVDHFKLINDTEGHQIGDRVLIAVADALKRHCSEADLSGRFGGDEFLAALSCGSVVEAEATVTELMQAIEKEAPRIGLHAPLSVSVGYTFTGAHEKIRFLDAFKRADQALFEAKRKGRAQAILYNPMLGKRFEERSTVLSAIEFALASGQIIPYYQPKICLETGLISGFEALARWRRSDGEVVGPGRFLQALEDPVYSARISDQVLDIAMADAERLLASGLDFKSFAVNVTEFQLTDDAFVDRLLSGLKRHGLDPAHIELELTEGILLSRYPKRIETRLQQLSSLDIKLAFDDFGTGFASLTHLHRYPIDTLKLDMSFIKVLETDRIARSIVGALAHMASNLGMTIVAEGVETEGAARILKDMGCDLAQGFLYSPAAPIDEVAAMLSPKRLAEPPSP